MVRIGFGSRRTNHCSFGRGWLSSRSSCAVAFISGTGVGSTRFTEQTWLRSRKEVLAMFMLAMGSHCIQAKLSVTTFPAIPFRDARMFLSAITSPTGSELTTAWATRGVSALSCGKEFTPLIQLSLWFFPRSVSMHSLQSRAIKSEKLSSSFDPNWIPLEVSVRSLSGRPWRWQMDPSQINLPWSTRWASLPFTMVLRYHRKKSSLRLSVAIMVPITFITISRMLKRS